MGLDYFVSFNPMINPINIVRGAVGLAATAAAKVPAVEKKFRIADRLDGDWPEGPFLWLHGASLGECKMLLRLAEFLQKDIPQCPKILITTQKTEVYEFFKDPAPGISFAIAPADTPSSLTKFVSKVKPLGLVLGENELWPGYLSTMKSLSLKPSVAIVSGRFRRAFPFLDFSAIGFASMQTGADQARLQSADRNGALPQPLIGGDWKLLSWAKSQKEVTAPLNPTIDTAFLSMHMAEWTSLIRMVKAAIKHNDSVVLMPRRISEAEAFRKALREQDIIVTEWPLVQKGAVTLVSSFGKTAEILSTTKNAVVGGSFSPGLGIHDFWEPLQNGVATCVGPYSKGQKETVCALVREGVLTQLQSTAFFSSRNFPEIGPVKSFLEREREKLIRSYDKLLEFLKDLLKEQG